MKKKSNKKLGSSFEAKVQKAINSGALWFSKSDLTTDNFAIECKYTEKKGFRITTKMLRKLWEEAYDQNKRPKLVIGIKDENDDWVLTIDVNKGRELK